MNTLTWMRQYPEAAGQGGARRQVGLQSGLRPVAVRTGLEGPLLLLAAWAASLVARGLGSMLGAQCYGAHLKSEVQGREHP